MCVQSAQPVAMRRLAWQRDSNISAFSGIISGTKSCTIRSQAVNTIPAQEIKRRSLAAAYDRIAEGELHIIRANEPEYAVLSQDRYEDLLNRRWKRRWLVCAAYWKISRCIVKRGTAEDLIRGDWRLSLRCLETLSLVRRTLKASAAPAGVSAGVLRGRAGSDDVPVHPHAIPPGWRQRLRMRRQHHLRVPDGAARSGERRELMLLDIGSHDEVYR